MLTIEIFNDSTEEYEFFKNVSVTNGFASVTFPSSKIGETNTEPDSMEITKYTMLKRQSKSNLQLNTNQR